MRAAVAGLPAGSPQPLVAGDGKMLFYTRTPEGTEERAPRAGGRPDCRRHRSRLLFCDSDMKIGTHFLATTLGVQAMGLAGQDRILAYTFGMAVDVDHLVKLPYYLRAVGLHDKRGYYWRSSLQEPVALLWILPLSYFLGTIVPVIFFAIHVAMDYSVRFEKMPFYPYSAYVTRGWLTGISDKVKERVLFTVLLILNVVVYAGWLRA